MRHLWATAVVALALAAAPAHAEPQEGKPAPALGNFEVVQGDPFPDLKSLRGYSVQLVFFATW